MSTELYRKYIDIINENSQPVNQLDEGKLAKALAILGLTAAGIAGQHMGATPDYDQVVKSPEFTTQLRQNLAKDKDYAAALNAYYRNESPDSADLAGRAMSSRYDKVRDQTYDQALNALKDQQPTIWNKIKQTVMAAMKE